MKVAKPSLMLVLTSLLLVTQPGVSCVSDGTTGSGTPSGQSNRGNRVDDGRVIPRDAMVDRDFPKGEFEWTSPSSGQVWIYDLDDRRVVDSTFVRRGEKLRVDPDEDRVWVDGDTRSRNRINGAHRHRIYILPDSPRDYDRSRDDRDRDRDRPSNDPPRQRDERPANPPADSPDNPPVMGPSRPGIVAGVPFEAQLLARGQSADLNVNIANPGRLYVVDMTDKKLVNSIDVEAGQQVKLDARVGKVFRDNKEVLKGLKRNHDFRIYFSRK